MTEAARQICEIPFEKLDIIRITGLVYEPNIASRKALENNNFILETSLDKGTQRKTTENELPSLTQCTA